MLIHEINFSFWLLKFSHNTAEYLIIEKELHNELNQI